MDAIESGIVKVPRVPVSDDATTGEGPDVPRPVAPGPRRAPARRASRTRRSTASRSSRRSSRAPCAPSTRDYERGLRAMGDASRHGHAAGVHRRLLEHLDVEARLRLDRRLGEGPAGRRRAVIVPGQPRPLQQRRATAAGCTARTRSWSTPPSSTAATPSTPPSEGGRARDRRVQARVRRALPGPHRRRHHRRGHPARGHEHGRQARAGSASTSAASCRSRC